MSTPSPYMPRLDGLRAIAVFGVLIEHFCPDARIVGLSPGGAGVTLFFVLSGYLITRILLNYQIRGIKIRRAAMHFYTRRLLRLSPPYYVAIATGALFGLSGLSRTNWWIPALYLTNVNIAHHAAWPGIADHFWSLAVEEQFYIAWFFVVVLLPARYFIGAVAATMALALSFRIFVYVAGLSPVVTVLLPGHIGTLAAGGLIVYLEQRHSPAERIFLSRGLLILSGLVFTAVSISLFYLTFPRLVLYPLSGALFFGCLIRQCAFDSSAHWLDWLAWRPLAHIGKISYGIYVYHRLIPEDALSAIFGYSRWAIFGVLVVTSVLIAEISWIAMEQPLLRFKNRFTTGLLTPEVTERPKLLAKAAATQY